jgi:hypothetical protein
MPELSRSVLLQKLAALHEALTRSGFEHAIGGGLALAFHAQPRFTDDIDINIFADATRIDELLAALPREIVVPDGAVAELRRTDQVRLFWPESGQVAEDGTPIDIFLPAHPTFHHRLNERAMPVALGGLEFRVVSATDLTILKVLFDRSKDWVDIEAMLRHSTVDVDDAVAWLTVLLGAADTRIERLLRLAVVSDDGGDESRR